MLYFIFMLHCMVDGWVYCYGYCVYEGNMIFVCGSVTKVINAGSWPTDIWVFRTV